MSLRVREGMLMDKLHLHVDQRVPPVQLPARRLPVALKKKHQEELEKLVERGIIAADRLDISNSGGHEA